MHSLIISLLVGMPLGARPSDEDFANQPAAKRPQLEVRYTDGSRTGFDLVAARYHLTGELRKPHRLADAGTGEEWLSVTVEGAAGEVYSSKNADSHSRINLYRRGPYFCEIHWLDYQVADESGALAPLKGDLALYCYPEKILASITWHAVEDFEARSVRVAGVIHRTFLPAPFRKGTKQMFSFPVFGEESPLPDSAFESSEARVPMRYDAVRGCYTIGSLSEGGFEGHFYRHPNRYETARFTVVNPAGPRKIYVCHENIGGDKGSVEGGVLLDADGHPLPMVVQISKNFAGEKEEKFYNPEDTPFSETYYPLYLAAGEKCTITSLKLYQNWGRHMVKQFSSLGAWMDYFHSSTGVTETTCYVPFKFAGLPGVDIADFRAMSQDSFWRGQPQHDNVAGHSFLSYKAGQDWTYLEYVGTTYYSTGPNWMDIGLDYLSTDGKIKATVRTFELPQVDELRNFIRVRYDVLQPLRVENARENFRLLTVATWVQALRYQRFAATGIEDADLTFVQDGFPIRGQNIPPRNSFLAVYGEPKGSNAIVLRAWEAKVSGTDIGPAASVWCEKKGDTRLLLVPDAETLELKPGDHIDFDAFWLPYGEVHGANTPRRECAAFGTHAPQVTAVTTGTKLSDFPTIVASHADEAEFVLEGGRDLVPVIVTGLTDYRWPRIWRKESHGWRMLSQGRVNDADGAQVFCESEGSFGATFLVHSDGSPQQLRVTAGKPHPALTRIRVEPLRTDPDGVQHIALIRAPGMQTPIQLRFPETVQTDQLDFIDHHRSDMPPRIPSAPLAKVWEESEGGSVWFEWKFDNQTVGGRLSPNEEDVDLEFWLQNNRPEAVTMSLQFCPILAGTIFDDKTLERTWIHTGGQWKRMSETDRGGGQRELCHYPLVGGPPVQDGKQWGGSKDVADIGLPAVVSEDGKYVFAITWPNPRTILSNALLPCVHADPNSITCPPGRRVHWRGKMYLIEGGLDDLLARVRREVLPLYRAAE